MLLFFFESDIKLKYFRFQIFEMKNIKSLLAAFLVSLTVAVGCKKESEPEVQVTVIKVGALLSKTGEWSNLGISSNATLEIGVQMINEYYVSRNFPYRLELVVSDTQLNPDNAAAAMQNFADQGITMVIGPQSSSEVAAIKTIADQYGILVVSQGSTASSLAIADDAIYRLCPGDQIEGSAMAQSIYNLPKSGLVTIARNDAGNLGLQSAVGNQFELLGGEVLSAGSYDISTADFNASLDAIREGIISLNGTHPIEEIGVYLASFDEAVQLFEQAYGDPTLSSVQWFGGDGFIKNQALLSNTNAASFAFTTSFFSPEFGLPESASDVWAPLKESVLNRCGYEADAFTLATYDALWIMAKMIEVNNGPIANATSRYSEFESIAQGYNGATGNVQLNNAGDRSNGAFDYWGLQYTNSNYEWIQVGQSE